MPFWNLYLIVTTPNDTISSTTSNTSSSVVMIFKFFYITFTLHTMISIFETIYIGSATMCDCIIVTIIIVITTIIVVIVTKSF